MSESLLPVSTDSRTPFVDEDQPFRMKWGTLKTIIVSCIVGAVAVAGWAINVKMTLSSQDDRSKRIETRIESLETSSKKQTEAMYEQRMDLKLMDQKLDQIARGQAK